ncbi:DNA-binding protein [Stenotrophomonas acidaminiphila]|uniref:DNA-binding protein n=1 Tax=Stenotrophomonas acidaminiphila TaxID=128780 RepID=A0A0S1B2C2_9GAMM|nr:helix-turn-helix domain-containing protein [Stenotrophomonas acidaminiphila]ALJ29210.1 DNA-binding protein [Stenotrophomonas acidaminiphila]
MSDERFEFSRRLGQAMSAAGYEPRPAVLFRLFNARYTGRSVSFQSASRWLSGRSIPEQDKLQVLAELFGVAPQTLRFGEPARVAEARGEWNAVGARERAVIDTFLALPPRQRELVGELVKVLAQNGKRPTR